MSALDQAIIKAYAKDRPAASGVATPPAPPVYTRHAPTTNSTAVEETYRDGSLYRLHAQRPAASVPASHLTPLPPTSPRRNVRRSLIRLLAANEKSAAASAPEAPPQKIARKVIIRHVSHSAAPPPLGLLRTSPAPASAVTADLLPEPAVEEPIEPALPAPAKPATPEVAPLNVALAATAPIDIAGRWLHAAAIAPMMIVADGLAAKSHPAFAQHIVQVDALPASALEARAIEKHAPQDERKTSSSKGKNTLDLRTADAAQGSERRSRVKVYIDAAHPSGPHRPHARFRAAAEETPPALEAQPEIVTPEPIVSAQAIETAPAPTALQPPIASEPEAKAATPDELPFSAAFDQALASDLLLVEPVSGSEAPTDRLQEITPAAIAPVPKVSEPQTAAAPKSARPVWEVDRFQWPRTCEKLLSDTDGYLATAGDKLLAAVQDGLKVLAITGTRRGEGRSTLALCLARSAARSGIEVAVMDADFLRPQLASKLGLETAFGWQDAALGKIPLSEAAVKSLHDGITVMPLESAPLTRRLSLADPRVTATIRAAAATFELLILDLGPSGPGQQVLFPPGETCPLDAAIVVRDLRFTAADEAEAVGEMLHASGIEAVGVAENFVVDEEIPSTSV